MPADAPAQEGHDLSTLAGRLASLGMSPREMADAAESSESSAYRWIRGEVAPIPRALKAIAKAARVSPRWLETGEGSKEPAAAPVYASAPGYSGAGPDPAFVGAAPTAVPIATIEGPDGPIAEWRVVGVAVGEPVRMRFKPAD